MSRTRVLGLLVGGVLVLVGYFLGTVNRSNEAFAQQRFSGANEFGFAIPKGGAAVVRDATGVVWLIDTRGNAKALQAPSHQTGVSPLKVP